jgi:hypothetical protein
MSEERFNFRVMLGVFLIFFGICGLIFIGTHPPLALKSQAGIIYADNTLKDFDPFEGETVSIYIYDDASRYYVCNGFSLSEVLLCYNGLDFVGNPTEILIIITTCENKKCIVEIDRQCILPRTL